MTDDEDTIDEKLHDHIVTTLNIVKEVERLMKRTLGELPLAMNDLIKLAHQAHGEAHRLWRQYGYEKK